VQFTICYTIKITTRIDQQHRFFLSHTYKDRKLFETKDDKILLVLIAKQFQKFFFSNT